MSCWPACIASVRPARRCRAQPASIIASRVIQRWAPFAFAGTVATTDENYKSRLLEYAQSHGLGSPRYVIVKEEGPDHDRTFTVEVLLTSTRLGVGTGSSNGCHFTYHGSGGRSSSGRTSL